MNPRPILKAHSPPEYFPSPSTALPFRPPHSPHVHFPPTPTIASTQTTYSPFAYDRAPIIVSPNACALPKRGGRMYIPHNSTDSQTEQMGSYFHPRAFEACEPELPDQSLPPPKLPELPLTIPDLSFSSSSDSDESDTCSSPLNHSPTQILSADYPRDTLYPSSRTPSKEEMDMALSFLPHPPSSVKDRRRHKRKIVQSRDECFQSITNELSLDGCLGGF